MRPGVIVARLGWLPCMMDTSIPGLHWTFPDEMVSSGERPVMVCVMHGAASGQRPWRMGK
jgi:hypothetical protein